MVWIPTTFEHGQHVLKKYVGKSISELQIQVATYVFELSAENCHR